jgi:peptidoglycan/LPS O-acetylase OafA/YrhL
MSLLVADRVTSAPTLGLGERLTWVSRGRIPALDGLRGISILFVLAAHAVRTHPLEAHGSLATIARQGGVGVDVFFVISGFLITLLLLRELQRTGQISLKAFYQRRTLRILPAYLAFVTVVFALTRLGFVHLHRGDWPGVLTYTVNYLPHPAWEIGHVWSLSIEEQFYLLWPLTLILLGPHHARRAMLAYLVVSPLFRGVVWVCFPQFLRATAGWSLEQVDNIVAGSLLALLMMQPQFQERMRLSGPKALRLGWGAAAVLLLSRLIGDDHAVGYVVSYSGTAISIAILIWVFVNQAHGRVGRVLESRALVAVGTLSYSLYLWQQLFLNPYNTSWVCRWPVNLGFVVLAALLSHHCIETPFLRLKERYGSGPRAGG